ncbi:hypothetical protein [Neobacillus cucumis]|uniref:hypothetical protein n=1 Tax=Neobacillus cucumis TaxID=1740721 RepID=UPI0019665DD4|nr:hypothetical protein [Neobacillus cucumis]MBM7656487.1 hypothetical protein [Neobacillus cucumis]
MRVIIEEQRLFFDFIAFTIFGGYKVKEVRDNFLEAVEKNGKSMTEDLKKNMKKYIWKQSELQRNRQK